MSAISPPKPRRGEPPPGVPPRQERPSGTVRWGTWVARRRWWMLAVWGVILVASTLAYPHLMSSLVASDYSVTGSDSSKVTHLLESDFPAAGAEQDVIVFDSGKLTIKDKAYQDTVDRVLASVKTMPGVASLVGPTDPLATGQVSQDGHAALASLGLSGNDRERGDRASDLQDAVQKAASNSQVNAYLTGYSPSANDLTDVENADVERAESFGVPVAFIVLLLALGAVVAASVPLVVAVSGLMATFGILSLLSTALSFDAFLLSIVTMIGVGVAIDYSLFILARYREELAKGRREGREDAVPHAVGIAMTTSGRTILFSGTIVVISLASLFVVKAPIFRGIAFGAMLVVACTIITAWTLLPALLAALGDRVNRWALPERFQPAETEADAPDRPNAWRRWAQTVLRHPWIAAPAAALLILFALPTVGIKLGIDLGLSAVSNTPSGKAELILADKFSEGVMSPTQVMASHRGSGALTNQDLKTIDRFTTSVGKDPRVLEAYSIATLLRQATGQVSTQALAQLRQDPATKSVVAQMVNVGNGDNRTVITVVPKDRIDSDNTTNMVKDLRSDVIPSYTASAGPEMLVGGATAQFADLADETMAKLPVVMGIVLTLSFLYLLLIFRSLLLPLKAVLMNLLATAAAFGLVTWVFQDGHLEGLFGFTSVGFIQAYLPVMVFAVLFGLSMDYEVFLIRRMQEQYALTHDNDDAVATGIAYTARPIMAAAAIMAAVFGCFLVADVLELKQFGFALAIAVILDATLVRLLLVPAFMKVAGNANWWLPGWMDRHMPHIRVD